MNGVSLIVFDLDGTLVDSERDLAESTNEMLSIYGVAPLPVDAVAMMVGEGARMLVRRALAAAEVDADETEALTRFRDVYDRRLLDHTRPYPGIVEVLRIAVARAPLAVLTNKPEAPSRRILEAFDLASIFKTIVGGDSGFPRKPDPAGLQHLMASANVPAERTLVVGDSMIDVETARRGGAALCVARYGFGQARGGTRLAPGEWSAETPAEVGVVIEQFLNSLIR
jgi:phosphoglycolate phosphatase